MSRLYGLQSDCRPVFSGFLEEGVEGREGFFLRGGVGRDIAAGFDAGEVKLALIGAGFVGDGLGPGFKTFVGIGRGVIAAIATATKVVTALDAYRSARRFRFAIPLRLAVEAVQIRHDEM
jgi:hypothetical protein